MFADSRKAQHNTFAHHRVARLASDRLAELGASTWPLMCAPAEAEEVIDHPSAHVPAALLIAGGAVSAPAYRL
jgi:hypothetical protein